MTDAWMDRYHEYERRAREAFKIPDGPERDQAFADADREYSERASDEQKQLELDKFEEAKAELWASILREKPTPPELAEWSNFFENVVGGNRATHPRWKTLDQYYAIGRFLWLRNKIWKIIRFPQGLPESALPDDR